jgi:hypothetical protein
MINPAWLAGFFDGEGCIRISKSGRSNRDPATLYYRLEIEVVQKYVEPLTYFERAFGGNVHVHERPDRTPVWAWRSGGDQAGEALQVMLPYLIVKKRQALVAVAFSARKPSSRTRRSNEFYALNERDKRTLHALKRDPLAPIPYPHLEGLEGYELAHALDELRPHGAYA